RDAFMRYRGQGHEITVGIPTRAYGPADGAALRELFDTQYRGVFGRTIPGLDVETITWVLTLTTQSELPPVLSAPEAVAAPTAIGERALFDPGSEKLVDAKVYDRDALAIGARITGPAVIVEPQTATIVPLRFEAVVNAAGHLILSRVGA
ncbi:MAG: hydantoinase/oxoprolinase family protein, partial [Gammaproteobacteria bacterium]|nr:hydantoinase/oxoprolinase family protein [Gammaproteobacteria bacterium]